MAKMHQLSFWCILFLQILKINADNEVVVSMGSMIKLTHDSTKFKLHSHEIAYGSGSGQQSVTGFDGGNDANDYWLVRNIQGEEISQGVPIKKGQKIRLQHSTTRRWLHSHLFPSPLSNQQEVSAYGDDIMSDTGDHWVVEWDKGPKVWSRDQKVRLRHVDTGAFLTSGQLQYGRPIAGQQEVSAKAKASADTWWFAAEGVYFPEHIED